NRDHFFLGGISRMRLRLAFTSALAVVFVLLTGCDDAPPYKGAGLPTGYNKYTPPANPLVALDTSAGRIELELFEDDNSTTPLAVTNFIELIESKFYDGKIF